MIFSVSISSFTLKELGQLVFNLYSLKCWGQITHLVILDMFTEQDGKIIMDEDPLLTELLRQVHKLFDVCLVFQLSRELSRDFLERNSVFKNITNIKTIHRELDKHYRDYDYNICFDTLDVVKLNESFVSYTFSKSSIQPKLWWLKIYPTNANLFKKLYDYVAIIVFETSNQLHSSETIIGSTKLVMPVLKVKKYDEELLKNFDEDVWSKVVLHIDTVGLRMKSFDGVHAHHIFRQNYRDHHRMIAFEDDKDLMFAVNYKKYPEGLSKDQEKDEWYLNEDKSTIEQKCLLARTGLAGVMIGDIGYDFYSDYIPGAQSSGKYIDSIFNICVLHLVSPSGGDDCISSIQDDVVQDEISLKLERRDKEDTFFEVL